MTRFGIPFTLQTLIFVIPLNIYVIGDWLGSGIQTLFFRYQQTNIGNSLIFLNREMSYIINGILTGKSAFASAIWCVGVTVICFAMLVIVFAYSKNEIHLLRYTVLLNLGGAILFTIAIFIQYGITLHGPAGIAIPFGIPVIFGISYYQNRWITMSESDRYNNGNIPGTD
jgi:hypothetical protein